MNKIMFFIAAFALIASVEAVPISFQTADTNSDGKLDKEEFLAAQKKADSAYTEKRYSAIFKKKDMDEDGFLSETETPPKANDSKKDKKGKTGKKGKTEDEKPVLILGAGPSAKNV